jgi:Protein of unknown function DUF262
METFLASRVPERSRHTVWSWLLAGPPSYAVGSKGIAQFSRGMMDNDQQIALMTAIDEKIGEVRTEAIDLSFGEIVNLKTANEIRIDPEYQRLFRWSAEQKSRLVESILLRLPIPPVYFVENEDGRYELIDGLQRISSIIQFIEPNLLGVEPLELTGCDIISPLNGYTYEALPLTLRLQVKRSAVRAIIIKRQSKYFLRYEMFKRLNTGGSLLSPQEIRNCSARLFGQSGVRFYDFVTELSKWPSFLKTTETLADVEIEKRGREELVLRFFAAKNGADFYHGHVADWLDTYMEAILLERVEFNFQQELGRFQEVFDAIAQVVGDGAFCKYTNNRPVGGLAPAHFEAIAIAFSDNLVKVKQTDPNVLNSAILEARQTQAFRDNVGPGANKRSKLAGRIQIIGGAIIHA